jgi:hypothetical protein
MDSKFTRGQLVRHTSVDPYSERPVTKVGIVLETLGADPDDEGDPETGRPASYARSIIGWFDAVSGPVGDHLLTEA